MTSFKHHFVDGGVARIGEYACVCGMRGSYVNVAQHVLVLGGHREIVSSEDADTALINDDDAFGGATKAHYLPNEPRRPAPALQSRSIAESFQDMLRITFQAGIVAAASGETFESWYQREVLE